MPDARTTMRNHLKGHLKLYVFIAILFVMGVIFGALLVNSLSPLQKQEIGVHLDKFVHAIGQDPDVDPKQSFRESFGHHFKWIIAIWLLGLTVIGLPIILVLDFLKGAIVGFTVGYMVGQSSWKGMLFALVSVAPQNIVVVPALMICSVSAIAFSVYLVKNRWLNRKAGMMQPLYAYTLVAMMLTIVMFAVSMFEAFVSPVIMRWAAPALMAI